MLPNKGTEGDTGVWRLGGSGVGPSLEDLHGCILDLSVRMHYVGFHNSGRVLNHEVT